MSVISISEDFGVTITPGWKNGERAVRLFRRERDPDGTSYWNDIGVFVTTWLDSDGDRFKKHGALEPLQQGLLVDAFLALLVQKFVVEGRGSI